MAKQYQQQDSQKLPEFSLSFTCPNQNCPDFNKFDPGNLSIAERMGKDKAIRLGCAGLRPSERILGTVTILFGTRIALHLNK